jgi:hypothetical protein
MTKRLVGYDLRYADDQEVAKIWTADRRRQFLLRPDVRLPISVDSVVMPTVFSFPNVQGKELAAFSRALYPELPEIPIDGGAYPYSILHTLSTEEEVRAAYACHAHLLSQYTLALLQSAVIVESTAAFAESLLAELPTISSPEDAEHYVFAGFDVVDDGGLSALSNFGTPGIRGASSFAEHVNEFGLLDDIDAATKFREVIAINHGHGPFFVFDVRLRLPFKAA